MCNVAALLQHENANPASRPAVLRSPAPRFPSLPAHPYSDRTSSSSMPTRKNREAYRRYTTFQLRCSTKLHCTAGGRAAKRQVRWEIGALGSQRRGQATRGPRSILPWQSACSDTLGGMRNPAAHASTDSQLPMAYASAHLLVHTGQALAHDLRLQRPPLICGQAAVCVLCQPRLPLLVHQQHKLDGHGCRCSWRRPGSGGGKRWEAGGAGPSSCAAVWGVARLCAALGAVQTQQRRGLVVSARLGSLPTVRA